MESPTSVDIRLMLWNLENFFILSDQQLSPDHTKLDPIQWNKLSTSIYDNKPLDKIKKIAECIHQESPDIIALCEVGGLESLQNFNELFLDSKYSPALIEGNSDRNIDVGFLIKKEIGFYFDLITNKNRLINFSYTHERSDKKNQPLKFSRDVAELHLFLKSRENPFLIILLTHLKSHLDPDGIDPRGFERRQAELKTLVSIYNELQEHHGSETPILVCGDLNGNASAVDTEQEFLSIYENTNLKDALELAKVPSIDRATYYQINRGTPAESKQLDYCFLSPAAAKLLSLTPPPEVYRYRDNLGMKLDPPKSLDEKMALPSDHYPVLVSLKSVPVK